MWQRMCASRVWWAARVEHAVNLLCSFPNSKPLRSAGEHPGPRLQSRHAANQRPAIWRYFGLQVKKISVLFFRAWASPLLNAGGPLACNSAPAARCMRPFPVLLDAALPPPSHNFYPIPTSAVVVEL